MTVLRIGHKHFQFGVSQCYTLLCGLAGMFGKRGNLIQNLVDFVVLGRVDFGVVVVRTGGSMVNVATERSQTGLSWKMFGLGLLCLGER